MSKKFYFNEKMVPSRDLGSFSPSWKKPREFRDFVKPSPESEVFSLPCTPGQLKAVHAPGYVDDVLLGKAVNGFGIRDEGVADSFRYTCGGMTHAAVDVLGHRNHSACVPVSGFHHAGYDHGGGFCTFNGLMVAAHAALEAGAQRVGIFDADQHYGDGTVDILRVVRPPFGEKVQHWTVGEVSRKTSHEQMFLQTLKARLYDAFVGCDLLLYQAGADCHVDDPLGGWMTTEGMQTRDQIVFDFCKTLGIPYVWCLAGGYQDDFQRVLQLHANTYAAWQAA